MKAIISVAAIFVPFVLMSQAETARPLAYDVAPQSVGDPHTCSAKRWYTPEMFAEEQKGREAVRFVIGTDGHVRNVEIAWSSGTPEIENAALGCVSEFQYKPAMKAGVAIDVEWAVLLTFCSSESTPDRVKCNEELPMPPSSTDITDPKIYPTIRTLSTPQ